VVPWPLWKICKLPSPLNKLKAGFLQDLDLDLVDPAGSSASPLSSMVRSPASPPAGLGGEGMGSGFDPACSVEPGVD
jgi:hypothetical protein